MSSREPHQDERVAHHPEQRSTPGQIEDAAAHGPRWPDVGDTIVFENGVDEQVKPIKRVALSQSSGAMGDLHFGLDGAIAMRIQTRLAHGEKTATAGENEIAREG